jgi:uncharacterized protein (TIGR04255 family)
MLTDVTRGDAVAAADLGTYTNPPVVEVVAAVRFEELPAPVALGVSEFWRAKLASDLPDFSSQGPYQAPVEQFDRPSQVPEFTLDLMTAPPMPRVWLTSASGDELVQLQTNWMACNWRKVAPSSAYGRWGSRRDAFQRIYEALESWIEERGFSLRPNQCEVTYINHVYPSDDLWTSHTEAHRVFTGVAEESVPPGMRAEQREWQSQFRFEGPHGMPGRLHLKVQPAFNVKDDVPIFVMELTARGAPAEPTMAAALDFLDEARRAVVTTFGAATTPDAQRKWGRQ